MRAQSNHRHYTASSEILIEVTRGSMVESVHRGFIVAVDGGGNPVAGLGDINVTTYFRSAAKPFQSIPLISSGAADHFQLNSKEIAVINGSHSGEPVHLEVVRSILHKTGIDESALMCGSHMPFDDVTARQLRSESRHASVLHNNCSGKHAGMLALARFLGEKLDDYIDPAHPIQRKILEVVALFAGVPAGSITIAVDGCSAPVFGMSIASMARSYARLAACDQTDFEEDLKSAARRVVDSMIEFPEMVGGHRNRLDTDLMKAAKGQVISKVGAEGVQLLGVKPCNRYPMGLGIAIKIEDGDIRRARDPVVLETLRQLGILDEDQLTGLSRFAHAKIHNHRRLDVGELRTCFKIEEV
ncbi:MAG: asparaginase [Acidobacteria bacterium]|nr:asparaginase [Acidobacteriota bacterium]